MEMFHPLQGSTSEFSGVVTNLCKLGGNNVQFSIVLFSKISEVSYYSFSLCQAVPGKVNSAIRPQDKSLVPYSLLHTFNIYNI